MTLVSFSAAFFIFYVCYFDFIIFIMRDSLRANPAMTQQEYAWFSDNNNDDEAAL